MLQHLLDTTLLDLGIDLLRHEAILLDSEGDGIKPGALHRDRNAYASGNGTAPIPVSSGRTDRYRLNRAGNRRLNEAIHTVALVQSRGGTGRAYLDRKKAAGKTNRDAMRALKRRLSDVIYQALNTDQRLGVGLQRPLLTT